MTALHLDRIVVSIGGRALFAPLTVRVDPGVVASVIGPSGSGKSTLLTALCGAPARDVVVGGQVRLGAAPLDGLPPEQRRLGLVFQDDLLFPHLSVADNLAFGLRAGGGRAERRRRAAEALQAVGLAGFGPRDPATLSGGQRARVALLRVLLSEPRAVLLDEPFGSLDADTRDVTRRWVFDCIRERGVPALLVTHDRDDVDAAGGPVIALQPPQQEPACSTPSSAR